MFLHSVLEKSFSKASIIKIKFKLYGINNMIHTQAYRHMPIWKIKQCTWNAESNVTGCYHYVILRHHDNYWFKLGDAKRKTTNKNKVLNVAQIFISTNYVTETHK